ncbi:MAG: primosomal protein N', partial [Oscillospiraceae bacterium]|nr:primosomal protein N' [Oscillospiraceae bacterium]
IDVSKEEISEYIKRKKPKPSAVEALNLLSDLGAVTSHELCYFTGISPSQLNTLKKNGIVHFEDIEVYRRPKPSELSVKQEVTLNDEQNKVFSEISAKLGKGPACALLYGVTGSGKTLVYFKLIEEVIAKGKKAILLVPEIALTPQLLSRVYAYFGNRTAIMHSALSVGERYDEWKRIKNGEVDVVVGTRSAIFSPLSDIGIIILDEEQEDTYKSSTNPRYHARDAAKFRCVSESALLVLGSATPSVESMYHAKVGKYSLHTLANRFNEKPLPRVIVSDLRKSLRAGSDSAIGKELYAELAKNIESGEQSILFLNRRGASKYMVCDECCEVPGCPNCSVPLVYHSKNMRLMCHHCGYSERAENECSVCGGKMRAVGFGTQRIEEELLRLFPGVGIVRMDTDTTSGKASHEKLLNKFRDEKIPILLGTQMITKGLDFENVTLVGVISADQAIFNESYRASENAFSLITQVVGRAGRGEKEGRAVIQTYSPKNFIIQTASSQNYDEFFSNELCLREIRDLPPFSDIFSLTFISESENKAFASCSKICRKLASALSGEYGDVTAKVLGPTPLGVVKVGGKFRYKLLVCAENNKRSRDLISRVMRDFLKDKENKEISIIPDINSTDF